MCQMRILVTGATGYVGGAMTRRLLGRGDAVKEWDERPTIEHAWTCQRPRPRQAGDVREWPRRICV